MASPATLLAIFFGLLSASIWSAHSSISVTVIRLGWDSFDLNAARICGGLCLSLPWLFLRLMKRKKLPWKKVLALTAFGGVPFSLINMAGLQFAPITHAAAISLGMVPLMTALLGKPLFGTAVSRNHWLALAVLCLGIITIWTGTSLSPVYLLGDLCFFIGATLWAFYALHIRKWNMSALDAVMYANLGSTPYLLFYFCFRDLPAADTNTLLFQFVYQGMAVGVLALWLYGKTVHYLGSQLGTLFTALVPPGVPFFAIFLLQYQPTLFEFAGAFLVVAGMLIAFFKPLKTAHD